MQPGMRQIEVYPITFEQWAAEQGIDPRSYASAYDLGDYVGNIVFPQQRTAAQKGKQTTLFRKIMRLAELKAQYEQEVTPVVQYVPLDLSKANDQAYQRVQAKRAARVAAKKVAPTGEQCPGCCGAGYRSWPTDEDELARELCRVCGGTGKRVVPSPLSAQ